MTAPLIVTALIGEADFARLDGLRRAHFPPERNVLRAHLTLFHHLPPSVLEELRDLLRVETRAPAPRTAASAACIAAWMRFVRSIRACGVPSLYFPAATLPEAPVKYMCWQPGSLACVRFLANPT